MKPAASFVLAGAVEHARATYALAMANARLKALAIAGSKVASAKDLGAALHGASVQAEFSGDDSRASELRSLGMRVDEAARVCLQAESDATKAFLATA